MLACTSLGNTKSLICFQNHHWCTDNIHDTQAHPLSRWQANIGRKSYLLIQLNAPNFQQRVPWTLVCVTHAGTGCPEKILVLMFSVIKSEINIPTSKNQLSLYSKSNGKTNDAWHSHSHSTTSVISASKRRCSIWAPLRLIAWGSRTVCSGKLSAGLFFPFSCGTVCHLEIYGPISW